MKFAAPLAILAASIFLLCPGLAAKEKEGARIEVEYRVIPRWTGDDVSSGRLVGELLAVRADSLLLVEDYSELTRSIDVRDILRIKIKRKSPTWLWGGLCGVAAGLCAGSLLGALSDEDEEPVATGVGVYIGAVAGGLAGLAVGGAAKWKTFEFAGRPESEVQAMLARLSSLARVGPEKHGPDPSGSAFFP